MKKIYNIIDSELILRTNNHKLRQEFGEVGSSANITTEGNTTIFTTKAFIREVNYITVNGLILVEGVHYVLGTDGNTIRISNSGAPVRKNPGLTTTILASYYAGPLTGNAIRIPPVVNSFTLNKYSGKNTELLFDFSITANGGKNIFWSILRDGNSTPLYSGTSLVTVNGVSTSGNVSTTLNHFITEQDFIEREGQDIPFTLVVIYDLTEDASHLDEKIIKEVNYKVANSQEITGLITVTPETIVNAASVNNVGITYAINNGIDYVGSFEWVIYKAIGSNAKTIVRQGNQSSPNLSGTNFENVQTAPGDNYIIRYTLEIKENGAAVFTTVSNDKVTIAVPQIALTAKAGYLNAAVMSYVDPLDNVRKKIGSLGTSKDVVEYNDRVPRTIFTKEITKAYLTSQEFISAPVNVFEGTVTSVYFVIELPDNWGPVSFYQTLGLVEPTAFNKIPLGNGYTAYLYNVAPSSAGTPSNYYLKAK